MTDSNEQPAEIEARPSGSKRAAVLCAGPSLAGFGDRGGYDLRIGVNRAVGAFRCDYWVALDVHTAGITKPIGQPVIVNKRNIYRRMRREFPYVGKWKHLSHADLPFPAQQKQTTAWARFGATVALVLAASLKAQEVDCFGVDWSGEEDFDGFTCPKNRRTDKRWQRERQIWHQVCAVLSRHDVTVSRVGTSLPLEPAGPR